MKLHNQVSRETHAPQQCDVISAFRLQSYHGTYHREADDQP